jgi:hypothetical protein
MEQDYRGAVETGTKISEKDGPLQVHADHFLRVGGTERIVG